MDIVLCGDRSTWDEAVKGLGGCLYQSWQWGELSKSQGWSALRVLATDGSTKAALQVLERKSPVLGTRVMYAPRGVLISKQDYGALGELCAWLRDLVRRRRAVMLRVDPEISDADARGKAALEAESFHQLAEEQWSVWNLPRAMMVVNLALSEEQLLGRMRESHRYNIRRALRNSLEIELGSTPSALRQFYDLLLKTAERQKFLVRGLDYFLKLRELCLVEGQGVIGIARSEGQPVAGVLCVRFGRSCYYIAGGFDWLHRNACATEVLQWKAMLWAKENGCTEYNLLGAGTKYPPSEPHISGVYRYKKGLGAELRYYAGYFDLIGKPIAYRVFRCAERHANTAHFLAGKSHAGFVALGHNVKRLRGTWSFRNRDKLLGQTSAE